MFLTNGKPRILVIGAHPDDVELGAGGFVRRAIEELSADVWFLILTCGCRHWKRGQKLKKNARRKEARRGARRLGIKGKRRVEILNFQDCNLQNYTHELIEAIERRLYNKSGKRRFDIVLTHAQEDTHKDHKCTYEATISAARAFDGVILLYQAPSTSPNEFRPTFFVNLDDDAISHKKKALVEHVSQREKSFMSHVQTDGMAKSWALFLRMSEKRLEAFEVYRSCWD